MCINSQYRTEVQSIRMLKQFCSSWPFFCVSLNLIKITAALSDPSHCELWFCPGSVMWLLSPVGWFMTPGGNCISLKGLLSSFFPESFKVLCNYALLGFRGSSTALLHWSQRQLSSLWVGLHVCNPSVASASESAVAAAWLCKQRSSSAGFLSSWTFSFEKIRWLKGCCGCALLKPIRVPGSALAVKTCVWPLLLECERHVLWIVEKGWWILERGGRRDP